MKIKTLKQKKLGFENNKDLTLFFTGTGSAFTKKYSQNNLLILKGNDHLMIDCGLKTAQTLHDIGFSITKIENYLITHSHADHIGGLEEAGLMGKFITKKKPKMVITPEYQKILWDMSLKGGSGYNHVNGRTMRFTDYWYPIRPKLLRGYPRETYEVNIDSINIKMFRTKHVPDNSKSWKDSHWSTGIIIDERILFSSDTRYDEDLILSFNKKFKIEAIFHDTQLFTGGVHSSLDELNQLPKSIKKKTFLVHYSDNWEQFIKKAKEYGFAGFGKQHIFYIFD